MYHINKWIFKCDLLNEKWIDDWNHFFFFLRSSASYQSLLLCANINLQFNSFFIRYSSTSTVFIYSSERQRSSAFAISASIWLILASRCESSLYSSGTASGSHCPGFSFFFFFFFFLGFGGSYRSFCRSMSIPNFGSCFLSNTCLFRK